MFSSSVRRVASTATPIPTVSSFSNSAQRAVAAQALSYRSHQRRYSSSKPSSPADGSKGVTHGQGEAAAAAPARPEGEKKASRASKKKSKDLALSGKGRDESLRNLPCVPSTHHISPNQISASDFFSLYRPISLTSSFPKAVSEEAFASIFTQRIKANSKPTEVISTLSQTVENLDMITGNLRQLKIPSQQQEQTSSEEKDELRAAITAEANRKELQHLDSAPEDAAMRFPRHILSGKYQSFNPPPAPVPENTPESLAAGLEASQETHKTYTSVVTISESTDKYGEITYFSHSTPSSPHPQRCPHPPVSVNKYLTQIGGVREYEGMFAISVKRQRKLKMKKHKYKKLMRRTRNLRRRLDRN
ncbi:hypothetical protein LHYA1_G003687 [Lachnellula hyalina]|uniref:Small ribosomal subunit protein mS38 n=1 Tax=Lachnellula hyalina TaxID=1316788 RepID=A0A8H8TZH6_9HELO|nr:uncharacterized protein LHYA1_G003687 [Lachnellula hyalina]TVY28299.1 hypothetical protein LHYA1_G003687 [Lachnellula hyalina]